MVANSVLGFAQPVREALTTASASAHSPASAIPGLHATERILSESQANSVFFGDAVTPVIHAFNVNDS
jgi:hypothetical protein